MALSNLLRANLWAPSRDHEIQESFDLPGSLVDLTIQILKYSE